MGNLYTWKRNDDRQHHYGPRFFFYSNAYARASHHIEDNRPSECAYFPLGLPAPLFMDVLWVLNSFVKGMNSGAPGRYFRRGSGTLNPYYHTVRHFSQALGGRYTSSVW